MPIAANESDYVDKNCLDEAMGKQWGHAKLDGTRRPVMIPDASPGNRQPYYVLHNGGLMFRHRAEFYEADVMVRFARAPAGYRTGGASFAEATKAGLLNSPWWLNDARFEDLVKRARSAGVDLVEMARRQLAIPEDWSSCDMLVVARPKVLLAAYAGYGRSAESGNERRLIALEQPDSAIEQLYIPGLGRQPWLAKSTPNKAPTWLSYLRDRSVAEVSRTGTY